MDAVTHPARACAFACANEGAVVLAATATHAKHRDDKLLLGIAHGEA